MLSCMHAALTRDAFFQVWQVEKRYSMFDGLPVVFTDDYATVTEEWLAARYEELQERLDETFDWARLHADHWMKSIQQEASSHREAKRRMI